jgi:hypothetical protein
LSLYVLHAPPISFFWIWSSNNIGWAVQIIKLGTSSGWWWTILKNSRGQPTRGGPPAWGLGDVLTNLTIKTGLVTKQINMSRAWIDPLVNLRSLTIYLVRVNQCSLNIAIRNRRRMLE